MPLEPLEVRRYCGAAIAPHVPALAQLRIAVFREFPYLYDGSLAYEERYLQTYVDAPGSVALLAFAGDNVVGASTGVPLEDETADFQAPFVRRDGNVAHVFYCGESIVDVAYRGRGLYRRFFAGREAHALELGTFSTSTFCAVERPREHPLRPVDYRGLDTVWKHFGYVRHPELATTFAWKDVDRAADTEKSMVFWLKALRA
jgi:hypothetical protein